MSTPIFLQVALNGDSVHPATPRTPEAIAEDALAVMRAIRSLCPGLPISLTTSAAIESDPARRLRQIQAWEELPDQVSANQGEVGIVPLCEHLLSRGVQIEAGLLSVDDARAFVASGLGPHCRRILVEALDLDATTALAHAAAMEEVVRAAGMTLEQVHHGYGPACWAIHQRALERGHGIRTGLEDVTVLPDGSPALDNRDLTVAARRRIASFPELA